MNRSDLLDKLTEDVVAYVMQGSFPESQFADQIQPEELENRFYDYEMLMRLHYVLDPDVVEFVRSLPTALRTVETETTRTTTTSRGNIEGRIDWSGTIRTRYSRNPSDTALFVSESRSEHYDTAENVVLKRLIALIYHTVEECESYLTQDYQWVTETWGGNEELIDTLREIFEKNVHVSRIRSPAEYEPTERMIQRAERSRTTIYRTAADLLERYRETLDGDPDTIRTLLDRTAITPDDDEVLFELYVLFRFIGTIDDLGRNRFRLRTIESGKNEVAKLVDGDEEFVLYHNQSAGDRGLSFLSDVSGKERSELSRTEAVQQEASTVAEQFFTGKRTYETTGRPDVIVLEINSRETTEYLITEVKYSNRPETIRRGIRETLEYLAFLRDDGELVHSDDELFGSGWNGILVTDDIDDTPTAPTDEQRSIRIVQASDIEAELKTVLERALEIG